MLRWVKIISPVILLTVTLAFLGVGCARPDISFFSASFPLIDKTSDLDTNSDNTASATLIADLESKIRPSVVAVDAENTGFDNFGNPKINRLAGTGWILDTNGLIVTNNHIIEGATSVTITLDDGLCYPAKTIRTDPINDIAVIDIGVDNLPAIALGNSSAANVGDTVIAVGNALGKKITATQGSISRTGVTFSVGSRETLYNTIETTAEITWGNSGGPLLNMDGEVIGIISGATVTIDGREVTGYAISIDMAKPVIQQLVSNGNAVPAWLGVTVSDTDDFMAAECNQIKNSGACIIQITDDSPAYKCGLMPGDVIVYFNNQVIASAEDLSLALRSCCPGQETETTYWREGTQFNTSVTPIQNSKP